MRDFSYLRAGIWDFEAKRGRDSGLKIFLGTRDNHRDYGIAGKYRSG